MSDETATPTDTDRFAAQLQKDARSWAARDTDTEHSADATLAAAAKAAKAATARRRTKTTPKPVIEAAPTKGRPFSMSYEGVSNAQYIADRIARGAR